MTNRQVQTFNNVVAGLRELGLSDLVSIMRFGIDEDRVHVPLNVDSDTLFDRLDAHPKLKPWAIFENHGPTAVASWREDRDRDSMQIVLHRRWHQPILGAASSELRLEVDFDYHNPAKPRGVFRHLLEVLRNTVTRKKTDPFTIAKNRGWPLT